MYLSKKAESLIREAIATDIRQSGGWAVVTSGSIKTAQGTPDIIATVPDPHRIGSYVTCAIEVKTEVGKPSILQEEITDRMGQRGFAVFFPDSLRDWHREFKSYVWSMTRG